MKIRTKHIIIGILVLALVILFSIFFYYFSITKRAIKRMSSSEPSKTIFSVYVLSDDQAQELKDTIGYTYGISSNETDKDNMDKVIFRISEELGEKPEILEYSDMFKLIDELKEQKVKAIVINQAYKYSISETEGYEWTDEGIRKIESFEFENANEDDVSEISESVPDTVTV